MNTDKIEGFLRLRDTLIDALEAGNVDKNGFVATFIEAIEQEGLKAVPRITGDPFVLGLYNYQYHNAVAKKAMMDADELRFRDSTMSRRRYDEAQDSYAAKERTLMEMIELLPDEAIEAYPLKLDSSNLSGEIFEVVFIHRRRAIFHARDPRLKMRLMKRGVFMNETMESRIHSYVNEKYV